MLGNPSFVSLAIVIVCHAPIGCGGPAPQVREAATLFEAGDYAGVEEAVDRQLARDPDDPALWRIKIEAAARRGDAAHAAALYVAWHHRLRRYDTGALRRLAIGTLWHGLRADDPEDRAAAIAAIAARRLHRRADFRRAVAARLDDDTDRVAAAAAVALGPGDSAAKRRLDDLIRADDPRVRAAIVTGLVRADAIGSRAVAALDDPAPAVRRAAIRGLPEGHADRLAALARSDPAGAVRAQALTALTARGHRDLLALARAALADEHLGARLAALAVIAEVRPRQLAALADGDDLYIALRAAVLLRRSGAPAPDHALSRALGAPIWTVRAAALNALLEIVPAASAPPLLAPLLVDDRVEVRMTAARVLARLGDTGRAAQTFAAALEDARPAIRVEAAVGLLHIDDERGREALVALAGHRSSRVRTAAARAYRNLDQPELSLVALVGDPSPPVRLAAADALLYLAE